MKASETWSQVLGRHMTWRLMRVLLPNLKWNQEIYGNVLGRFVDPQVKWLDAGSGWRLLGEDLDNLEDELVSKAGAVFAVDIDADSMTRHRNILHRVCGSLNALPFPDNTFDLVTCNMVVEHLPEPLVCFREATRVLVHGGVLIVHTPNTRNYLVLAKLLLDRIMPRRLMLKLVQASDDRQEKDIFPTYYRANSIPTLRRMFHQLHLRLESVRVLTAPQPYFLFFAPLAFVEILAMRASMSSKFSRFGATLLAIARREESGRLL